MLLVLRWGRRIVDVVAEGLGPELARQLVQPRLQRVT
jgi:hypothetical protein